LDEADLLADEIAILAAPGKLLAQGSPVSLKSKLGQGYVIHVTRTSPLPTSPDLVLSAIRIHAPLASPDESSPGAYILRSKSASVVGHVLDELEQRKEQLEVEGYDVRGTTMEAIFLELMGAGEGDGKEVLELDELAAVRDSGYTSAAESILDGNSDPKLDQTHEPLALSDGRETSPFRQALTGFHKRALILRRSWLSYALMVVIAIAGACVPVIFMEDRSSTCDHAKDIEFLNPLYLPAARTFLPLVGGQAMGQYKPIISPPDLLSTLNVTGLPRTTVPDANAFAQALGQMYRNLTLGGLEIQSGGVATVAWEASPGSVSGLALLNLASNVLVNRALGKSAGGPRIIAYFQNLPGTRIIDSVSHKTIAIIRVLMLSN
jgi:ATP-binding cassette subfamily A (ABC1) protein 3